jgi:hypothetical protein
MATASLSHTAKTHWRALWPVWALPAVVYVGAVISETFGQFEVFLFAIAAPLIGAAYIFALRPWTRGSISYWHAVFWLIVVPGLISLVCTLGGTWIMHLVEAGHLAS